MRKRKVDEKKQTLDTKIYPVVRLGIKPLLLHVIEALYREYCFSATKSLPGPFLPRHQGLQVTTVTLASGSTKKFLHKRWGLRANANQASPASLPRHRSSPLGSHLLPSPPQNPSRRRYYGGGSPRHRYSRSASLLFPKYFAPFFLRPETY